MNAACMNAVRSPDWIDPPLSTVWISPPSAWVRCGWIGEVSSLSDACPRCLRAGMLSPVVNVPKPSGTGQVCSAEIDGSVGK